MSCFWPQGIPIEVTRDSMGAPTDFVWDGQTHAVEEIICRWRVDENWWTGARQWREYFRLATITGLLVEVYHDLARSGWRLQRLYD